MSGRGGKRRQVLQLGKASKLHHYGYSKSFHTSDKTGKGSLPVLVGNYSNSDSEDSEDTEEHIATDVNEEEEVLALDTTDAPVKPEQPADMDDELKNFLSEIEAIPAVPEMDSTEQPPVPMEDVEPEPEKTVETDLEVKSPAEVVQDTQKPVPKPKQSSYHYSMFVKGESEFVHSPKPDTEDVKSPAAATEEDIPDEPTTNWQMVKDENTHYYYYWNTATNEVTWEIPTKYTQYLLLHREYEEKVAKYSPEQLEKLKEKQSLAAGNDSGDAATRLAHPKHADKSTDLSKSLDGRLSKVAAEGPDGSARDTSRSRSVSPRPEPGQDSRPHKHKKEKRSHHKKKHKRRHSDSQSDEDRPSQKVPQLKKPPVSSETSSVTLLAGSRLTSIVPYLSDQDDSDEDNNVDPVPLLGSAAVSVTHSQDKEHGGTPTSDKSIIEDPPQLELLPAASQDIENIAVEVSVQLGPAQATADTASSLLVFSPPPPPPPPPQEATVKDQTEEEDSDLKKNITQTLDEPQTDSTTNLPPTYQSDTDSDRQMIDSASPAIVSQFAEVEIDDIVRAIVDPQVEIDEIVRAIVDPQVEMNEIMKAVVDPVLATRAADETQAPAATKSDSQAPAATKSDSTVDVAQPVKEKEPMKIQQKEVIDMFAEDFPMPVSVQRNDVAIVDKGSVATEDQVRKGLETPAVMEDGEILKVLEKEAQKLRKGQEASSATPEKDSKKKSRTQENSLEKKGQVGISLEKDNKTSESRAEKRSKAQESSVEKGRIVQEDSLEKKIQPQENSLEKSKMQQNGAEISKTLDKSRNKTRETSSEKIRKTDKISSEKVRSKTHENSSEKVRSKTQENSSEKVRSKTHENSSGKVRDKMQENSSEKSRSRTQEISYEKARDKTQEDSSEKIRSKTQENSSGKIRNKTHENRSEKSRHKQDSKSEKIRSKPQECRSEKSDKKIRENSGENKSSLVEQTAPKSVNIVGYASDEEEGEVRETVVSKADKPTRIKQRDNKKESKKRRTDSKTPLSRSSDIHKTDSKTPLSSSTDTHRIDSKTPLSRSSDIHKTDSKTPLSSSPSDSKLGPELVSRVPVSLTEVTPEATFDQVAEKPVCEDADDDIDFDIDDIDRALELALEKKLEKKKIQLQSMTDNGEIKVKGETVGTLGELTAGPVLSSSPSAQIRGPDNGGSETSGDPSSVADPVKKVSHGAKLEEVSQREDEKLVADIRNMAELALSKLEFLDISTDNLSRLQVLFIELQTRFTDWTAGGLTTQYFHGQLKTAEQLLEQYELSAVPEGWACQWDRYAALDFPSLSDNRMYGPGVDVT